MPPLNPMSADHWGRAESGARLAPLRPHPNEQGGKKNVSLNEIKRTVQQRENEYFFDKRN